MNQEPSKEEYNKRNIPIPDQLNIIINTSIPGFQKIEYRPSMTIKDTQEKHIIFNPLIKLDKSIISKIPKEYQIKEFFNKGLFQSLINHLNKQPVASLLQATRQGYIDNNIKVILDTIFSVNSVIYVDKKPYAIADVRWTTGDWKIDVKKKKEELDINKIKDPYLRSQLINEDLITGQQQLNEIPPSLLVGNNYNGPAVVNSQNIIKTEPKVEPKVEPKAESKVEPKLIEPKAESKVEPKLIEPLQQKDIPKLIEPKPKVEPKLIEPSPPIFSDPKVEVVSDEENALFDTFKEDFKTNINLTNFFRNYFKSGPYSDMIKDIYSNFPNNLKKKVNKFYDETSGYVKKETISKLSHPSYKLPPPSYKLSPKAYNLSCENVSVVKSISDGNCFFQAVSDGINIYNYGNQSNKIIHGNYGKTQLFTIALIRDIVYKYIIKLDGKILDEMFEVSEAYLQALNDEFTEAINSLGRDVNPEEYKIQLNNIYHRHPNFLVYKPESVPVTVDDYDKPFKIIKRSQLEEYIKSKDYWATDIALKAVCSILEICIITIETYVTQNHQGADIYRLKALLTNYDQVENECSTKKMFLLLHNNHFELIRFNFINNGFEKWNSIFTNIKVPPIHILFLLYGTMYVNLSEDMKKNFSIYESIMESIELSIKNLKQDKMKEFEKSFYNYFRNSYQRKPIYLRQLLSKSDINGGAPPYRYPPSPYHYPPSPYHYPPLPYHYPPSPYHYPSKYIPNKPQESKISKIAYVITIDMELYPGTKLTAEQLKEGLCYSKYNAIRKAYSEFIGKPYLIPPAYNRTKKSDIIEFKKNKKTRKNNN